MKIAAANLEPPDEGNYSYTVAATAEGDGRYINTRDQKYGHVRVVIAQGATDNNQFEWNPSKDALPYPFMKDACHEGMNEALQRFHKKLVRLRITVVDGSYHDVDTDAMAVRMAMMMAVHDALSVAKIIRA